MAISTEEEERIMIGNYNLVEIYFQKVLTELEFIWVLGVEIITAGNL